MEKSLGVDFKDGTAKSITDVISGDDGIIGTFTSTFDDFKEAGTSKITQAVNAFNKAFDNLRTDFNSSGGNKTFWGTLSSGQGLVRAVKNIGDDSKWFS